MANQQIITKLTRKVIDEIERALRDMRFGSVQIIVQDSRIIQIDKVEKIRLDKQKKV